MKILGCILIIVGCSFLGFKLVAHLRKRIEELSCVRRQIVFLRGEIRCGYRGLPEIFGEMERRMSGVWKDFYGSMAKELKEHTDGTLESVWEESMEQCLEKSKLIQEEKKDFLEFGQQLGKYDKNMQIAYANICEERFCQYIKKEQEQFKTRAKLYQTLSVLGGIFLTVLLV